MTETLRVDLGSRSYDIIIGVGLIAKAGDYLKPLLRKPRVIIVTDETVAQHYLKPLQASLDANAITHKHIILPAGEQTKRFSELENLLENLLAFSPDRNVTLIALGGGVIGDITGFAASILLRGVDFIQIPTTLLAQVDSSVGGKTGINSQHGKNLIGSFYQPRLVLADIGALETLSRRELLAGYAEVVKYGIINDEPFFAWLEKNGTKALAGDIKALAYIVKKSCEAKADIVRQDELEAGVRALLNFGHTLGHALEAECGFSDKLLHGEAVSIGMVLALRLSVMKKLFSEADYTRVLAHFKDAGLPISPKSVQPSWDIAKLIEHCTHDKKAMDSKLTFILAKKIGNSFISHDVNESELEALLAETL